MAICDIPASKNYPNFSFNHCFECKVVINPVKWVQSTVCFGLGIIQENEDENNVMKSNGNVTHYIIEKILNNGNMLRALLIC